MKEEATHFFFLFGSRPDGTMALIRFWRGQDYDAEITSVTTWIANGELDAFQEFRLARVGPVPHDAGHGIAEPVIRRTLKWEIRDYEATALLSEEGNSE